MKKLLCMGAVFSMSLASFAASLPAKKVVAKKPNPAQREWVVRCRDGEVGHFTCGCTQNQANQMGSAWCNAR